MIKVFDSKLVGIFYMVFSFISSLLGFSFSLIIRIELSGPFCVFTELFYFVSLTSHGLVMLFFFLTMLASGFSNFFLPSMCFQSDMFLCSVNVFSFWLVIFSFVFMFFSLVFGEGVSVGWTLYTPLSSFVYSSSVSLDLLMFSIHLFSLSSMLGSVNILVTVFISLSFFVSILSYNIFIWSYVIVSVLVVLSIPSFACVITMLLFDSVCGCYYFIYEFGGDSILFQVMFWVWGHPEVYILVIPVFGIISQVVYVMCGVVFNFLGVFYSLFFLFILSFLVWGHHMVVVGWGLDLKSYFMISTMVMSFPTSVKIFSWLFSLFLSSCCFSLSLCCFSLFLFFFGVGGVTGLFLSNSSLDVLFHDTYFVVGHFHFVLANASVFGFLSGFSYLFNFVMFNCGLCLNCFMLFVSGFSFFVVLVFSPFHFLGFLGLPSSVPTYPFDCFILFYFSNLGFIGVWFSYLLFGFFVISCLSFLFFSFGFMF